MSVYQNNNGELIPIAGGKAEYGASTVRTGSFKNPAIGAQSGASLDITFDTPMPDNDYIVELSQDTLNSLVTIAVKQNSKTTTGFTVLFSRPYSAAMDANRLNFTYTAFKLYTDTEYNSILEGQRYSTDEVDTGKIWIDGKKIYRKCFTGAIATYTDSAKRRLFQSDVLLSGVSDIVSVGGCCTFYTDPTSASAQWVEIGSIWANTELVPVYVANVIKSSTDARLYGACDQNTVLTKLTYKLAVEYTKV